MLRLVPVVVALVILGAHFYRAGDLALVAIVAGVIVLAFVPRRWAARATQLALVLGALEWVHTLALLIAQRQALGAPWMRMSAILGAVALLTAGCALVYRSPALTRRYAAARVPAASVTPIGITRAANPR